MRDKFTEFYVDDQFFNKLWRECVFVFDTNVLLNLYRYTENTTKEFLEVLNNLRERIWIPHQVGLEFNFNRIKVIKSQLSSYSKIISKINDNSERFINNLRQDLSEYIKRHPSIKIDELINGIREFFEEVKGKIQNLEEKHPNYLENDPIFGKISELFNGKVGDSYDDDELNKIFNEGEQRYKCKIPPGYKDDEKKGIKFYNGMYFKEKYSDLVLWKQILDFASKNQRSVIFVTDDEKEDWWEIMNGETVGPRYELLNEFKIKTKGKNFYMYKAYRFLEYAKDFLHTDIKLDTIKEVQETTSANNSKQDDNNSFNFEYLTDSDWEVFRSMLENAERSGNSNAVNAEFSRAYSWAKSTNERRRLENAIIGVKNNIYHLSSSLPLTERVAILNEMRNIEENQDLNVYAQLNKLQNLLHHTLSLAD
jgi:hypothetical protein